MKRFPQIAFFALATFAVIFAGATTDRSTAAVLGQPGGCGVSSSCTVGGHGTGGENSGGAAKGFHDRNVTFPDEHPGEVINNSGNDFSGHITTRLEDGTPLGSASGGYARGIDDFVGHSTGVFGDCNGPSSKC